MQFINVTRGNRKERLELTSSRLQQQKNNASGIYVKFSSIRKAFKYNHETVFGYWRHPGSEHEPAGMNLIFRKAERTIGCCSFTAYGFNKLLKAAGAK